jgi:RHS repeat-associated protein
MLKRLIYIPLLFLVLSFQAQNQTTTFSQVNGFSDDGNGNFTNISGGGLNNNMLTSENFIAPNTDGSISYTITNTSDKLIIGLSVANTSIKAKDITYRVWLNNKLSIWENKKNKGNYGNLSVGDVVEILRVGDQIIFKSNNNTLLSLSTDPSLTLFVKLTAQTSGLVILHDAITGDYYEKMELSHTSINETCVNPNTGSINLTVEKGLAPYTFEWSNNATEEDLLNLSSGQYTVTVTDAINNQESITVNIASNIIWKYQENLFGISNNKILENQNGEVSYTVDQNGVKKSFGFTVFNKDDIANNIDYAIELAANGDINILENNNIVSGNFGSYELGDEISIERINGSINYKLNQQIIHSTVNVNSTLLVKYNFDVVGATFTNLSSDFCIPVIIEYRTINETKNHLGAVAITPISGNEPLNYLWEDGSTQQNRSGLVARYYTVNIVDSLLDTTIVNIPITRELEWESTSGLIIRNNQLEKISDVDGFGSGYASLNNILDKGEIVAKINQTNVEWLYGLRDASLTQAITYDQLDYGYYINANNELYVVEKGASSVLTLVGSVSVNDVLSIEKTATEILFKQNENILRQISYTAGIDLKVDISLSSARMLQGPFLWIPPKDGELISFTLEGEVTHLLCYSENTGAIDVTINGGIGPFTYAWLGPNGFNPTSLDVSGLAPGNYAVTVTDAGNLSKTLSFTVGYATFWKNLTNTVSDNNNLSKNFYVNQGWNAGASSTNMLPENTDGWASFILDTDYQDYQEIGTIFNNVGVFTFGLSEVDNGVNISTIKYGIRVLAGNYSLYPSSGKVPMKYVLVENGITLLDAFSIPVSDDCEIGDVFTIERVSNGAFADIIYKKNGVPVYISTNQPYDVVLITDASIYEGRENFATTGPPTELDLDGLPQIVNAASSFMCTDDPKMTYKANAWVKLIPPYVANPGGGQQTESLTNSKLIGQTSDVITGTHEIKFVYELWDENYTTLIESHEWYLLNLNDDWTFYQIEFDVTKQFDETNMLVYIKNDEIKGETTPSATLYIDDLVIYPADAKYTYTSNDKFGNATYVTDFNENHSQVIYDEWARPTTNIDANHNITNTFKYKVSDNPFFSNSYNEVTTFIEQGKSNTAREYLDGFGKVKQTIVTQPSNNLKIVTSTVEMDNLGRSTKAFKPFALSGTTLPNKFVGSYVSATQSVYGTGSTPYVENTYQNWPDAKVIDTYLPLQQGENIRTTTFDDNGNIPITFGIRAYYLNELMVSTFTNEAGEITTSYTDKFGRKIAQVTQIGYNHTIGATGQINENTGSNFEYATTIYEYDDANNLKKVIDPTGKEITYTYNSLGQIIQESNPDKGTSAYIYDKFGRLRFVKDQDDINQINPPPPGVPFAIDHFTYNKYDDFDRLVESGMIKIPLISPIGTVPVFNDAKVINDFNYPYTTSFGKETHVVYEFDGTMEDNSLAQLTDEYVYSGHTFNGTTYTPQTTDHKSYTYNYKGELATKVFNVDGLTSGHKYSYNYNLQGLPSQVAYTNPVNSAYNFTQEFKYDDKGALLTASSASGSNPLTNDVLYTYDPLGRLYKKGLSPTGNPADPFYEYVAYNYNIREGQVKEITKQFKNELQYDIKGNIKAQQWNNNYFDNTTPPPTYTLHNYDYYYDDLNRLTGADYSEVLTDNNPYATIETELKDDIPLIICGPIVLTQLNANLKTMSDLSQTPDVNSELMHRVAGQLQQRLNKIYTDIETQGKTIAGLTDIEVENYVRFFMATLNQADLKLAESSVLAKEIEAAASVKDAYAENTTADAGVLAVVNDITTQASANMYANQPDTSTIDSSLINTAMVAMVDSCNKILSCDTSSNSTKVAALAAASLSLREEVELTTEQLNILRVGIGIACVVNNEAMAYQTLINDLEINKQIVTSTKYDAAYYYTKNGNVDKLYRKNQLSQPTVQTYTYNAANNQLTSVNWNEFSGITNTAYNYDAIGNLTQDLRSDVTAIIYNQFHNLPIQMQKSNNDVFSYRYNAEGNRSAKVLLGGDVDYYIDGIVIDQNDKPENYSITEGFATLDGSNNLQKNYNITDWLGNIRLVMDATGNIQNVRDHFPYGLLMDGRTFTGNTEGARYQFTGHEFDGETMYGYHGARYYNRELGKYMSMDPLQTKFSSWSPYGYSLSNPINFLDPDGRDVKFVGTANASKREVRKIVKNSFTKSEFHALKDDKQNLHRFSVDVPLAKDGDAFLTSNPRSYYGTEENFITTGQANLSTPERDKKGRQVLNAKFRIPSEESFYQFGVNHFTTSKTKRRTKNQYESGLIFIEMATSNNENPQNDKVVISSDGQVIQEIILPNVNVNDDGLGKTLNTSFKFDLPKASKINIEVENEGRKKKGPGAFQLKTTIKSD